MSDETESLRLRRFSLASDFTKTILTLSTAGLGFSLAVLVNFQDATLWSLKNLLFPSWALYTIAIVAATWSMRVQIGAYEILIRISGEPDKENRMVSLDHAGYFRLNTLYRRLTGAAFLSFLLALMFTIGFALVNLTHRLDAGRHEGASSGVVTKAPHR